VKNITVSVEDEVFRQARIRAATWDTSVSALVRDFLIQLSADERAPAEPSTRPELPSRRPPGRR
jgi:plasmid stability protein